VFAMWILSCDKLSDKLADKLADNISEWSQSNMNLSDSSFLLCRNVYGTGPIRYFAGESKSGTLLWSSVKSLGLVLPEGSAEAWSLVIRDREGLVPFCMAVEPRPVPVHLRPVYVPPPVVELRGHNDREGLRVW
jgi:hypothetical protein